MSWKITWDSNYHTSTNDSCYIKNGRENKPIKWEWIQHWAMRMKRNYGNMKSFLKVMHPLKDHVDESQNYWKNNPSLLNYNITPVRENWTRLFGTIGPDIVYEGVRQPGPIERVNMSLYYKSTEYAGGDKTTTHPHIEAMEGGSRPIHHQTSPQVNLLTSVSCAG